MVKSLRIAQKKTLRQFCVQHAHDPSNWSKIERSINPPPRDRDTLAKWAKQLGLQEGTPPWEEFMMKSDIARGEIPQSVLTDERLMSKLPVFFRTVQGADLDEQKLDEIIRKIREAHTPDETEGEAPRR